MQALNNLIFEVPLLFRLIFNSKAAAYSPYTGEDELQSYMYNYILCISSKGTYLYF